MLSLILLITLVQLQSILSAVITSNVTILGSQKFDYLIVGGGTAGLVLANRLSADNITKVLVIDSGRDARDDPVYTDSANMLAALNSTENYYWPTVPQASSGKVVTILGGHVLGGSSSINGMDWTRASTAQYDLLESLGNNGWNYKSLLSYMKKAEKFNPPTKEESARGATYNPNVHGTEGLVGSGYYTPYQPYKFYQLFISAARQIFGLAEGKDLCDGNPNVASRQMFSIHQSSTNASQNLRSSSAVSYLYPIAPGNSHSGLIVLTEHKATRIVWSNSTGKRGLIAEGVEFAATSLGVLGKRYIVGVKQEIIVSAGAIMSPHLLLLSGVGNPKTLSKFNIPVAINLPSIGTGLQDQALNILVYEPTALSAQNPDYLDAGIPGASVVAFPTLRQLLGNTSDTLIANLKTSAEKRATAAVIRGAWSCVNGLKKIYLAQAELMRGNTPIAEVAGQILSPVYGITPWNLLPQTRGLVSLASSDPFVYPLIDPAYLDDEFDVIVQTAATKASRKLMVSSYLSPFVGTEIVPGSIIPQNASDAEWTAYVKLSAMPVYHPIGTVAMMSKELGGSVDSSLRLYGANNVRVVDASILPFQISAHLTATLYGVAEKAADIILSQR